MVQVIEINKNKNTNDIPPPRTITYNSNGMHSNCSSNFSNLITFRIATNDFRITTLNSSHYLYYTEMFVCLSVCVCVAIFGGDSRMDFRQTFRGSSVSAREKLFLENFVKKSLTFWILFFFFFFLIAL